MKQQNKFRKFINDIHLWLGLIAGIVLFIVCLSGSIYIFRSEIEYSLNPTKYNVANYQPNSKSESIEKLILQLQKQEKGKVTSVSIHSDPSKNYELGLAKKDKDLKNNTENNSKKKKNNNKKENEKPKRSRPITYFVDHYTGKIMGKDGDKSSQFFLTVMKLHRWLLLDDSIGRPIVGISTIIFIILSLSGLVLWFPKKLKQWKRWAYWKPGFKIKFKSNWKRINHDLHNTLGFYSLILLLVMAFTGLCWSFEWYKDGVSSIFGSEVFAGRNEKPTSIEKSESTALPLDQIIEIGNKELPYKGDIRISIPKDSTTAFTFYKNKTGFFALSASDKIFINPYTGNIISKDIFREKPLNVQLISLIRALHLGDVFGTFSKILYFITCLIGTSLPITGIFVWINKMKKSKKK